MTDEFSDFASQLLHQNLPHALARGIESYNEFSERLPDDSPKNFTAYHSACKAALGHLAALIKLGSLGQKQKPDGSTKKQENLEKLLQQARHVLLKAHNNNDIEQD